MKTKYTVDYFIKKFSKIPNNKWTTGQFVSDLDPTKRCALGHCQVLRGGIKTAEASALVKLIKTPTLINDWYGKHKTPKGRILAALREVKRAQAK